MVSHFTEIWRITAKYHKDLFRSEATSHPQTCRCFLTGLPQVYNDHKEELEAQLIPRELYAALMSLLSGRTGPPVNLQYLYKYVYKCWWSAAGEHSCRMEASELHERWFIPWLPKEGDHQKLKHQRPFLFALHGPDDRGDGFYCPHSPD